jgi:predicted  nucleic acid-binding Zn-ribbon protein
MLGTAFRCLTLVALVLVFVGCDSRPSYDDLKSENERLQSELDAANNKIATAKENIEDVRQEVNSLQYESCHEDEADDLERKVDDADDALDEN